MFSTAFQHCGQFCFYYWKKKSSALLPVNVYFHTSMISVLPFLLSLYECITFLFLCGLFLFTRYTIIVDQTQFTGQSYLSRAAEAFFLRQEHWLFLVLPVAYFTPNTINVLRLPQCFKKLLIHMLKFKLGCQLQQVCEILNLCAVPSHFPVQFIFVGRLLQGNACTFVHMLLLYSVVVVVPFVSPHLLS